MKKHLLKIADFHPHLVCCDDDTPYYRIFERVRLLGFIPWWTEVLSAMTLDIPYCPTIERARELADSHYGEDNIEWSDESP